MTDINRVRIDPDYWKELGAPDEATHFAIVGQEASCAPFEKMVDNQWRFWNDHTGTWEYLREYGTERVESGQLIPRPTNYVQRLLDACSEPEAPWDGEGAPTVGQTVKYLRDDRQEWRIHSADAWEPGDEIEVIQVRTVGEDNDPLVIGWNKRLQTVDQRLVDLNGPLFGTLCDPAKESLTLYEELVAIISSSGTPEDAADAIIMAGFDLVEEPIDEPDPDMPKDLKWLAEHLKVMPEGCGAVGLDHDGEVMFQGTNKYDYYPDKKLGAELYGTWSCPYYTIQEINEARSKLGMLVLP